MTGGDDVSCCPVELMVFGREIQIAPLATLPPPGVPEPPVPHRGIDELKAGFPGRILDQNAKRLRL